MTVDTDGGSRSIESVLQIVSVSQSRENINATIWFFGGHIADEALCFENSDHEVSHLVTSKSIRAAMLATISDRDDTSVDGMLVTYLWSLGADSDRE